jgi:glycyl-tRNA synthetase beta chain
MADFLLELGLEEIPARMIEAAENELSRRVRDLLLREGLLERPPSGLAEPAASYSTPRRLAVSVENALYLQPDTEEQLIGPSWKAAFRDGEPTAAAQAFARKAGVELSALTKAVTPKGEYVSAKVHRPGRTAGEVLLEHLPKEIGAISWPKSMYWRRGKPERFVRPVQWLVCLLDETVIPIEFAGIRASNLTYGHRILHGRAPIRIAEPQEYVSVLQSGFVLPDTSARRRRIRKSLDAAARTVSGIRWREDEALIEQVTHLTEWPAVVLGNFDHGYLNLPEEVLVTVMRGHQKYFAVEDSQGKLAPHFLAVLNTEVDSEGLAIIRHGNESVLRARFNDARFFWNYDQRISLAARLELLKAVTFQKALGSYFDKTEINLRTAKAFAQAVAAQGVLFDQAALEQATLLAKTDLTTELVKEFTELQGIIGGLYARAQGLGEVVAQAIATQYVPASTEDRIPQTVEGQLLGLADRMATIVEMFAIGLEPTGSKDPFGLRRAGNGIIHILAQSGLPLMLGEAQEMAARQSAHPNAAGLALALTPFLTDRLGFYLKEVRGYAYDVVNAVLAASLTTVTDAISRAQSLTDVRGSADMLAISAAFKRIKNILRQAQEKDGAAGVHGECNTLYLAEPAERRLHAEVMTLAPELETLRTRQQYPAALQRIAALRPAVDSFFNSVMVMAPEPHLRQNRLALIAAVLDNCSRIADFSEITSSGD